MKNFWYFGGAAVAAIATFVACTSSSNSGGAPGGANSSCITSIAGGVSAANTACSNCLEDSCSSQIDGYSSGCNDYLTCVCPGGTYNSANLSTCEAKIEESTCETALEALSNCETANCKTQCNTTGNGSSSGGSSSGSSSGGSSSGGSSSLDAVCQAYANCCENYFAQAANSVADAGATPGDYAAACESLASGQSDSTCAANQAAYQEAGVTGCQ